MTLPTEKVKATTVNPKKLIIFSKAKTGKSSLLAELPNNLIIDLENGTDYLDALKVKCNSFKDITDVLAELKKGHKYDYITIDTITKLEEMVLPYAAQLYKATPMGKNFDRENKGVSVLTLPNGAGK